MTKIYSNKIIIGNELLDGFVYIENGKIIEVSQEEKRADICYNFKDRYLSAGFIDMHTHGAGGYAFADSTPEEVAMGCDFHLKNGTTTIVPTVSASEFNAMKRSVQNIHIAKTNSLSKANILGAHLEGPYLSVEQCGAQCPSFITAPIDEEYKEIIREYSSSISRWTYAPENDLEGKFCHYLTEHGIIASAGHTNAKYGDMKIAIKNGCNLITHLYSCTSTITRDHGFRSLGVIESAYLCDELFVEIIADGKHLPPELIQMIIKLKGSDKVALITDSLEVAGADIKEGVMCGTEYIVEDGVAKLKDRSAFAGSVATADLLIRTLVFDCGYSLPESVKMLTEIPARIMNLNKGRIAAGFDADLIIFDEKINVSDVFVGGNKII